MASKMININQATNYTEYICDTVTDLNKLRYKEKEFFGSVAYVLENKKLYILNSEGEWEEQ